VLKAWGLPRSTFYERRRRPLCLRPPARRGPKTRYSDEDLLAEIRRTIQESPFHGEGHRKVWARLRVREVRTSMRRVLRLMRENDLLAPQRQPQPVEPKRHDGTILAERPNPMWGTDATVGFTVAEGRVAIFAMVDHATAESRAFPSPSAARGLRRWNRSARRCMSSLVASPKAWLAASDSGCTAPDFLDSFFDYRHAAASRASSL
jgi:hypothetical protein